MPPRFHGCFAAARLLLFVLAIPAFAADDDSRFSSNLSETQRAETGLTQLTEDNIAVIDALVRQDIATVKRRNSTTSFGTFSQRRTEHERSIAGLARLTPEQLARLDGLIGLRVFPPPSYQLNSEHRTTNSPAVKPVTTVKGLEIHGSVSMSYGWSKGGSVKGGEMTVTASDPSGRFRLRVGYAEYRGEGMTPYIGSQDDYSYRGRSTSVGMEYGPLGP
ncbi:MAG TPA: hypothetical protein VHO24_11575 [Opitutaceae bacterium]|nr:hypothetical protein [Opitutaceae bacterium]